MTRWVPEAAASVAAEMTVVLEEPMAVSEVMVACFRLL